MSSEDVGGGDRMGGILPLWEDAWAVREMHARIVGADWPHVLGMAAKSEDLDIGPVHKAWAVASLATFRNGAITANPKVRPDFEECLRDQCKRWWPIR